MPLVNPIGKMGKYGEEELGGKNDWLQHLINGYCHWLVNGCLHFTYLLTVVFLHAVLWVVLSPRLACSKRIKNFTALPISFAEFLNLTFLRWGAISAAVQTGNRKVCPGLQTCGCYVIAAPVYVALVDDFISFADLDETTLHSQQTDGQQGWNKILY